MIFEVFKSGTNDLWYFHLKAANNEIICVSEGYHNRDDIADLWQKYFSEWRWSERNGVTEGIDVEGKEGKA